MNTKTRKQKPKLYVTWDTETYNTIDKDGEQIIHPYLVGYYTPDDDCFRYSFEPHKEFIDFLAEKTKTHNLVLIAHNANYDLTVILKDYLSKLEGAKCDYRVADGKRFISFTFSSTVPKIKFICLDTSTWNPHIKSLKAWLKTIEKAPKEEPIIYDKWYLTQDNEFFYFKDKEGAKHKSLISDELKYLKRDCTGVWDVYEYQDRGRHVLYEELNLTKPKNMKKTSSSFVKQVIDSKLGENFFDNTYRPAVSSKDLYEIMQASSCGAFTCCNKNIRHQHCPMANIYSYDSNSFYPFIMYYGLPSGPLLDEPPSDNPKHYVTWYECDISEISWIEEFEFLGTPGFPSRWMKLDHTVFILKEYYDVVTPVTKSDVRILQTFYQIKNHELTPVIKELYNKKVSIDKEPGSKDSQVKKIKINNIKICLNSIYGQLCKRTYYEKHFYNIETTSFESEIDIPDEFRCPLAGVYVAQMGRKILINNIIKEHKKGNVFLYSDTDSLKFVVNTPVSLTVNPTNLGAWKNEGCGENKTTGYTDFHCSGKIKKWLLNNKNVFKSYKVVYGGVTKSVINDIVKYSDYDFITHLFDPRKNILIIEGKNNPNKRNKFGQAIIEKLDICTNGNRKTATHKMWWDDKNKKFILDKLCI